MEFRKSILIAGFSFGLFAFTSCQDNNNRQADDDIQLETERTMEQDRMDRERTEMRNNSVSARLEDSQELSTFSQGMTRAELDDDFREGEGPYTIFAPSNVAYDELTQEERDRFENVQNRDRTGASMHYLVIEEELTADELRQEIQDANGEYTLRTMQGEEITATMNEGNNITLRDASGNTATVTETDMDASNGVIHVIDRVLKPSDDTMNQATNRNMDNMNNMNNTGNNTGNNNTTGNNTDDNRNNNTTTGNNQ